MPLELPVNLLHTIGGQYLVVKISLTSLCGQLYQPSNLDEGIIQLQSVHCDLDKYICMYVI